LLPLLWKHVREPARIEEFIDNDLPRYSVVFAGKEFIIYAPDDETGESWTRATYAFFTIVNDQLASSSHRFYAINGGNELGGMFLTPAQSEAARETLPNKRDWPYIPSDDYPWHGRHH
jgi:hypothetical protein